MLISPPFRKESRVRAPLLIAETGALIILGGHVQRPRKDVELLNFWGDFINLTFFTKAGSLALKPRRSLLFDEPWRAVYTEIRLPWARKRSHLSIDKVKGDTFLD